MTGESRTAPRVLIGGVGYRWDGDRSFGLHVTDALAREPWPANVRVEDLGYGALYVALDLADARPPYDRLVLVAGVTRGAPRVPGDLYVERTIPPAVDDEELQARIREAGAGVLDLDTLLIVARHFGALPPDVVRIELEAANASNGDELSLTAAATFPHALALVRREAMAPLRAAPWRESEMTATS